MPDVYYGRDKPVFREWGGRLPVALVFPERAEHGLSTLGWQVVYRLLAGRDDLAVERFFWTPSSVRPKSVDSGRDLGLFPVVLLSLNFEGDYPAVLQLFQAADISVRAAQRSDWPLILAGGPLAFLNPFPVLPALDGVFVGEAEAGLDAVLDVVALAWRNSASKAQALSGLAALPGMLVPGQSSEPVRRQIAHASEPVLVSPGYSCFVSSEAQFRDMLLIEVNRGCPYGCRFCAAGSIYKPPRHACLEDMQAIVERCQPRKVGLVGTALTDWAELPVFLEWLHARQIKFSLSSLRADGLSESLLTFLRRTGTRSITLAVEGASQRLRMAMNKHFSEDAFFTAVSRISQLQFGTLKLYMITGWPGENEEDWQEFEAFIERVEMARRQGQGQRKTGVELISVSVSCLVPKPWTPLQWASMRDEQWFKQAMKRFKGIIGRYKGMRFSGENPRQARIQTFLSRGGEELFPFIALAAQEGLTQAAQVYAADIAAQVEQEYALTHVFPWDRLDIGISKAFLRSEWKKYHKVLMTPPCPESGCAACRRCGVDTFLST
ncbi:radical SAM protein [Desulfovibrionales bacterium]